MKIEDAANDDAGSGAAANDNIPADWVDPAEAFQPLLLESVIANIRNLPTLPSVAAYLLNHGDEEVHLPKVIQMLSYDQVMTARILRFANSAFVASPTPPKTVEEAIHLIGLNALRETVSISAVSGLMVTDRCPDFALKEFWRHSVSTACCAGSLAREVGTNARHAFTAGLLHDIGRIVLACGFPVDYSRTLRHAAAKDCPVLEAEQATLGIDHVQTGLELLKRWQLGQDLQEAIAGHHSAATAVVSMQNSAAPLPAIVYLSNRIAHAVDLGDDEDMSDDDAIRDGLQAFGLAPGEYAEMLSGARKVYRQALEALSL